MTFVFSTCGQRAQGGRIVEGDWASVWLYGEQVRVRSSMFCGAEQFHFVLPGFIRICSGLYVSPPHDAVAWYRTSTSTVSICFLKDAFVQGGIDVGSCLLT